MAAVFVRPTGDCWLEYADVGIMTTQTGDAVEMSIATKTGAQGDLATGPSSGSIYGESASTATACPDQTNEINGPTKAAQGHQSPNEANSLYADEQW